MGCLHIIGIWTLVEASVQFSRSVVSNSVTPWTAARQASLSFTISWSLLKLMSVKSVMPSNHLILCHPLLLPSIFPSISVYSSEFFTLGSQNINGASASASVPSDEWSRLISFRIDWFDLLIVQGTLESLLQHHNSVAYSQSPHYYRAF